MVLMIIDIISCCHNNPNIYTCKTHFYKYTKNNNKYIMYFSIFEFIFIPFFKRNAIFINEFINWDFPNWGC